MCVCEPNSVWNRYDNGLILCLYTLRHAQVPSMGGKGSPAKVFDQDDDTYKLITGNAKEEVKEQLWQAIAMLIKHGQGLDDILGRHIRLLSADIRPKEDEPARSEAKVVCEVEVGDGECQLPSFLYLTILTSTKECSTGLE